MKVDGECYCGAIAYKAEVQAGTATICHCADCQAQSGSAFRANISAPADGFHLVRGTPRTFIKTAASGNKRLLAFCGDCGSSLYACAVENPETFSLRIGTLKQRQELGTPQREIWTRRRHAWVTFPSTVKSFDEQP